MPDIYDGIVKGCQEVIEYQKGEIALRKSDWVEVVRCSDCRYYDAENHNCSDEKGYVRYWNEDDYCSCAERREDE